MKVRAGKIQLNYTGIASGSEETVTYPNATPCRISAVAEDRTEIPSASPRLAEEHTMAQGLAHVRLSIREGLSVVTKDRMDKTRNVSPEQGERK